MVLNSGRKCPLLCCSMVKAKGSLGKHEAAHSSQKLFASLLRLGDWNLSELEFVRIHVQSKIGICQSWNLLELEIVRIGICQNWNLSELDFVRIGNFHNRNLSELEFVRIGNCQNGNLSKLEFVSIGICQN